MSIKARFCRIVLRLMGWRVVGATPPHDKFVMVGAYHTSNMDALLMLLITNALEVSPQWLAKHTLFKGWRGPIMRATGAIPLDRATSTDMAEQAVQLFAERDRLALVIAPEGTRKKVNRWKSGFYYIALDAGVPIALGFVDYKKREGGIDPQIIHPTGDLEADFEAIRAFYSGVTARYPELAGDLKVIPRRSRQQSS